MSLKVVVRELRLFSCSIFGLLVCSFFKNSDAQLKAHIQRDCELFPCEEAAAGYGSGFSFQLQSPQSASSRQKARNREQSLLPSGLVVLVALFLASDNRPALAEGFTFRRVTVPSSGSHNRITVQIGMEAPEAIESYRSETPPAQHGSEHNVPWATVAAQSAGVEWFWKSVSPLLSAARPARVEDAFEIIAGQPTGSIVRPQLQDMENLASMYGSDVLRHTADTRVPPELVLAVMLVESAGRADSVSPAGAAGLMQLMPATAARFGVRDRLEPSESIRGGVAYLDWLLNHFGGDPILVRSEQRG